MRCLNRALKGRVHGLAHAHESKCCFFACARCSEYASNIISNIVKEPIRSEKIARVWNFLAKVARLMIPQLSACAPGSHLTNPRANSGKFMIITIIINFYSAISQWSNGALQIHHPWNKTFRSTINSTLAVLVESTSISSEFSPPPFYLGLL